MLGSVEVPEHSEETYAVVAYDLRGDGDLSGEVARFGEDGRWVSRFSRRRHLWVGKGNVKQRRGVPLKSSKLSTVSPTVN